MKDTQEIEIPIKKRAGQATLGRRFALVLLPLVLIPLLVMAAAAYFRSREILKNQAGAQLLSAAQGQIGTLTEWTSTREQRLQIGSQRSALTAPIAGLLEPGSETAASTDELKALARLELEDLKLRQGIVLFSEVMVVDAKTDSILVATQPAWEGEVFQVLRSGLLSGESLESIPVYSDPIFSPDQLAFVAVSPMRAMAGAEPDSWLVGVNTSLRLAALMEEMQTFWEERGVYRVERGGTYLALAPDIITELPRYSMELESRSRPNHPVFDLVERSSLGTSEYTGLNGLPVLGAYEWIPEMNLGVLIELPQDEVFTDLNTLGPFTAILVAAATVITVTSVILVSNRMLQPLSLLTQFAERISRGQWGDRVPEDRQDEVGRLASAFNRMSAQIYQLITGLEVKVSERTHELQKRALQVQAASEVARDASSITDIDRLLAESVNLIADRFNLYHVGVFLLDRKEEFAVLTAASSEGGKRMLQRGHKLEVGKVGLVGYVTGTGNPRIALDVGEDAVHFANPDLPQTRSELALPLKTGDTLLGALDVQSPEPNAFDQNDIAILQTMADQIALAIDHARVMQEQTRQATERKRVIELSQQLSEILSYDQLKVASTSMICRTFGFNRVTLALREGQDVVVRSSAASGSRDPTPLGHYLPIGQGVLGQTVKQRATIHAPGPLSPKADPEGVIAAEASTISVPLTSRGEVLGALAVEIDTKEGQETSLEVLELLGAQVAIALDNTRLFEETQISLEQLDSVYRSQVAKAWSQIASQQELLNSAETEYSIRPDSATEAEILKSLEAPINLRGETIGRLQIEGGKPGDWTDEEQEILQSVAEDVAEALEQIRLMEEIQRRATQLQTAAEISRDATGLMELNTLLQRAVHLIQERFELYSVSVYLLDEAGEQARIVEAAGVAAEALKDSEIELPVGSRSIIGFVTHRGENYLAADISTDSMFQANPLLPDTKSELVIPLRVGQRVLGALDIHHNRTHAFTPDDLTVMTILGDQIAVAIQNARLFEQAQKIAEREKTVVDVISKIRASGDIEDMLKTAVREMRMTLGAQDAKIRLKSLRAEGSGNGQGSEPTDVEHPESIGEEDQPGPGE